MLAHATRPTFTQSIAAIIAPRDGHNASFTEARLSRHCVRDPRWHALDLRQLLWPRQ